MKKHLLIAIAGLGFSAFSFAQISEGGLPTSFAKVPLNETSPFAVSYQVHELVTPDMHAVHIEDAADSEKGKPYRVGINIPVSYNMNNSGTWLELENGDKIWRMGVRIPGAQALSLYFSSPVQVPVGGKLHAYNEKHSQYVGAYTSNTPTFQAMEMIQGDLITLEYYMPAGSTQLPTIEIHEIAYYYRGVEARIAAFRDGELILEERAHGSCEVDAMCSEATGWEEQRDAAVHYSFVAGGTYVCTATVINNTSNDCTPYILTANHCGEPNASSDITNHVWYFNYQRPSCVVGNTATYTGALSETMSGGTFRASSTLGTHPAGSGSQVDGCDFVLVELNSAIPLSYGAYYAGWNRGTTAATSGVCFHHPAGDEKKISTYTIDLVQATYNGGWANAHWEVEWADTPNGWGVTEGGSSGSAIYDQNGRIVGHLSGGSSFCSTPTQTDLYGRFDKAWDQDGSTASSQLEPWLDPGNTGAMTLNGTYAPCAPVAPTADFVASATVVAPSTTVTFTDLSSGIPTSWAWVVAPAAGWAYAGGTTASSQNPQITFNTVGFYTITLTATNLQGSDAETKTNYIEVTSAPPGPCAATGTTCDEYISNVTLGAINNSTACTNYASYAATATLAAGSSYNISIDLGQAYIDDEVAAWIDWNDDDDFADANEQISYTLLTGSTTVPIVDNFTVPVGTAAGTKTMRVRISYSVDGAIDPCGTSTYGEVEDYLILVTSGGGSAPVANFVADNTSVPPGTTVLFTDLSTNTPTSWAWTVAPGTGWSYTGGTSATSQHPDINFTTAGVYTVTLVATNAFGSDSEIKTSYINVSDDAGVSQGNLSSVSIYPNPTNGMLTIDFTHVNADVISVELRDVTGRVISKAFNINGKVMLDLSNEATGIYFVKINTAEGTLTRKVIRY
jgi:lysyl endopeptidase